MSVMYILLPLAIALSAAAVATFVWITKRGQLDDLDTPPMRMLAEDD